MLDVSKDEHIDGTLLIFFNGRLRLLDSSLTVAPISTSERLLQQLLANQRERYDCVTCLYHAARGLSSLFLKVDHIYLHLIDAITNK